MTYGGTRRSLLAVAVAFPALATAAGASAQQAACVLQRGQQGLANALGYKPVSDDPKRLCGGCAFYTAMSQPADCGKCQLLNGSVAAGARCNNWAPKR